MAQKCFSKLGMYFEASKWLFARPLIWLIIRYFFKLYKAKE
jgi:hypothetical protein